MDQSIVFHNYSRTSDLQAIRHIDIKLEKATGTNFCGLFRKRDKNIIKNKEININYYDENILKACNEELDNDNFISFLKILRK